MSVNVNYHACADTKYAPSVQFVTDTEGVPPYYRLRLNPFDITMFATRQNLVDLVAAIAAGIQPVVESDESYEASEALLKPITQTVKMPDIPEWKKSTLAGIAGGLAMIDKFGGAL